MSQYNKYIRAIITQASSEGNLEILKNYFPSKNYTENNQFIQAAMFYTIRAGHVKCIEYLRTITDIDIDYILKSNHRIIWEINKKSMPTERKLAIYKYLSDNTDRDIEKEIISNYINQEKKDIIIQCIKLFRDKINITEMLTKELNSSRKEFIFEIIKTLREEKINSILSCKNKNS